MSSETCAYKNTEVNELPQSTRPMSGNEMPSTCSMSSSFPHPTRPVSINQYNVQERVYEGPSVHSAQPTEEDDREGLERLFGFISQLCERVPAKLEHMLFNSHVDKREKEGPVIAERGTTITSRGLQGSVTGETSKKLERFKIRTVDFEEDVKEEEKVKR